jgi:hypothetical protein
MVRPIPNKDDYRETVESARFVLPAAVEMEKLYGRGNVDHFITHYGFDDDPKTWNSEVHFGGRYCLTMQAKVAIDYRTNKLTIVEEPRFYLDGFKEIDRNGNGLYGSNQPTFGLDEWNKFYKAKGDVSVVGMEVHDGELEHFDGYVQNVRSNRIPISLLPPDGEDE